MEAQLESLKIYFDEKEDTTFADIIEKIRKLPKSSKVYFSQVTTLLKVSLELPATNSVSERSILTLNHCMMLAIYKEMTDKLSLIDVAASEFCFGKDDGSNLLGHIFHNDLGFKVCSF